MNSLQKVMPFVPWLSLAASFVAAAVASYVLVAHFQHSILSASIGSSSQVVVDDVPSQDVAINTQPDADNDFLCGCPFCCGIIE